MWEVNNKMQYFARASLTICIVISLYKKWLSLCFSIQWSTSNKETKSNIIESVIKSVWSSRRKAETRTNKTLHYRSLLTFDLDIKIQWKRVFYWPRYQSCCNLWIPGLSQKLVIGSWPGADRHSLIYSHAYVYRKKAVCRSIFFLRGISPSSHGIATSGATSHLSQPGS